MGAFLSHRWDPITTKVSSDEINEKLICGSSSMQGYRTTQEDAHNCILDFDANTSLFAVYDGHGGHEVAQYCSTNLPDFIKNTQAYKDGDMEKALIEGFLGFDATIKTDEVKQILVQISKERKSEEDDSSADEEENLTNLYEEAQMPIEKVIEKYRNSELRQAEKKQREDIQAVASSSTSSSSEASSSKSSFTAECLPDSNGGSSSSDGVSSSCIDVDSTENQIERTECVDKNENSTQLITSSTTPSKNEAESCIKQNNSVQNDDGNGVTSSSSQENGELPKKGKGKALMKTKGVETNDELSAVLNQRKEELKENMQNLYKQFLASVGDDNEDDEEETDSSEDSSDEIDKGEVDGDDDDDDEEEKDEDEEEDEEEEEKDDDDDEEDDKPLYTTETGPGFESGSTAVMAVLKNNQLFVANTGDSRCILCRNGRAVDMSIDHIPEDVEEEKRILAAGGKIRDGRVNGGLNLSRAIGDFVYKCNPNLSDREQMITALPDVKTTTIQPGQDEFLVIACDGIWNDMSSQEVVDFIRPRLEKQPEKLSTIIEEMFDFCLKDKSAMDNMTAIIVQFKSADISCKRSLDTTTEDDQPSKKTKTDTNESQIDTTV